MRAKAIGLWIVVGACACTSPEPAPSPPPPKPRPRATWTASERRTPPPPESKLDASDGGRVQVTVGPGRPARPGQPGWVAGPAGPAGVAPPAGDDVVGYDLVPNPDPHCPGWVAVPRYRAEGPEEDERPQGELPAGHALTLPPPPTPEPAETPPPDVEETLRPTEAGR
ncbi:MAG: hypothetical protein R3F62_22290 [Planctomycetota bacterium]